MQPNKTAKFGFPVCNIKVFKILFHRAYRLSGNQDEKALELYTELLLVLDNLLGGQKPKGSFYHGRIYFEMAKSFSNLKKPKEAKSCIEKGYKIFLSDFPKDHAIMLDYYKAVLEVNATTQYLSEDDLFAMVESMINLGKQINKRQVTLLNGKQVEVYPFLLESYFVKIQILMVKSTDGSSISRMRKVLDQMQQNQIEVTGNLSGNSFIWGA